MFLHLLVHLFDSPHGKQLRLNCLQWFRVSFQFINRPCIFFRSDGLISLMRLVQLLSCLRLDCFFAIGLQAKTIILHFCGVSFESLVVANWSINVSLVVLFAGPSQPSLIFPLLCHIIHAFEEIFSSYWSIYLLWEFKHLSFFEDIGSGLRVKRAVRGDVVGQFSAYSVEFVAMCVSGLDFCAGGEERLRRVHYKYKVMKGENRFCGNKTSKIQFIIY